METRKRLALWIAALGLFFTLTAVLLPCAPCPMEARDCDGSPRWVTPKEWLILQLEYVD